METTTDKTASPTAGVQATPAEGKLVLAYDGSDESRHAIEVAADVLGSRSAVVVFVGPMSSDVVDVQLAGGPAVGDYEELAVDEEAARERAVEGVGVAQKAGFSAEPSSLLASPAWMGIVDTADKVDAPVIVVGSRAVNRLREGLKGSTSHDLAVHAGRPVLIVPPAKHS
jgi:nucleotide-binding universal stress UspA family protein